MMNEAGMDPERRNYHHFTSFMAKFFQIMNFHDVLRIQFDNLKLSLVFLLMSSIAACETN